MKFTIRHCDDQGIKYDALMFVCPGCVSNDGTGIHLLPVNSSEKSPSWDWDGNLDAPTLSPSILTHTKPYVDGKGTGVCHSFLKAGIFEFLTDSTHGYSGKSVAGGELPAWATED